MSPPPDPQVGEVAAVPKTSTAFDDTFRGRLRDLLVWRRDVRRFRRDPLPSGTLEALIESACLAPSVGLSQPWRFVIVDDEAVRAAIRRNFATCNAAALEAQSNERAGRYAKLKLAGLEEAPCHFAVFADRGTAQGHGVGRHTMPEMIEYSAVTAVHTIWLVRARPRHRDGLGVDPRSESGRCATRCSCGVEVHRLLLSRLSPTRRHRARAGAGGMGTAPAAIIGHPQTLTGPRKSAPSVPK